MKRYTVGDRSDAMSLSGFSLAQINMRKVDGWQTLSAKLIDQPIDLAA
jgi:hypothetical protein